MTRKLIAGFPALVIIATLSAGCGMFGDIEDLREEVISNSRNPDTVPVITITTYPAGMNAAFGYTSQPVLTVAASVTEGATLSYQWYSNTSNSNNGGSAISGAIGTSYTIPLGLGVGNHYFFCEVRATGGAASIPTNVAVFNVAAEGTPVISIETHPASITVFAQTISESLSVTALVDPFTELTYQWYSNSEARPDGGTPVEGATDEIFALPTDLTNEESPYFYFCEVRGGDGAMPIRSYVATVTVRPAKTISIGSQAGTLIAVTAGSATFPVTIQSLDAWTTGSIEWYTDSEGAAVTSKPGWITAALTKVSDISATVKIDTTAAAVANSYYFKVFIDGIESNVGTLTVALPVIKIDTQPASTSVYAGSISGSLSVAASVTGSAARSYQWYSNNTNSNTGGTALNIGTYPSADKSSFTIPTNLTAGPHYYYCVVSATGGAASIRSNAATVTVNTPVININNTQPEDTSVSFGNPTNRSLTVSASVTDGRTPTYQWYDRGTTNSNTGGSLITGATDASFIIPGTLLAGIYYYYCIVSSSFGGAVSVTTRAARVTVVEGLGTKDEPFLVKSEADLRRVGSGEGGWTLSAHYKQTADIPESGKLAQGNWSSIGDVNYHFTGSYDGGGYTINGLTIDTDTDYQGMFGWLGTAGKVMDLTLSGVDINVPYSSLTPLTRVGAVVGYNEGEVKGCTVSGVIKSGAFVGGVAGQNFGKVTDCNFTGSVTGTSNAVGGIVGWNVGMVENCHADGNIKSSSGVGGVVGHNSGGSSMVKNCTFSGAITGDSNGNNYGGIAGSNEGTLQNCHATGDVSGYAVAGGVSGINGGTVTACEFSGSVTGTSMSIGWEYGGIVGSNSNLVENCHVLGSATEIKGFSQAGGVVGSSYQYATISACSFTGKTIEAYNFLGGGIVGHNMGTVEQCFSTGTVKGAGQTGGVAGDNATPGIIKDCYSTASVSGSSSFHSIGGIVGDNKSTVTRCYATGTVESPGYVGGIVGYNGSDIAIGTVSSCVALNPSIKGNFAGKVIGINSSGDLASNYARDDMTPDGTTTSSEPGSPISSAQWNSSSWWSGTAGFGAAWSLANSRLPRLAWEQP